MLVTIPESEKAKSVKDLDLGDSVVERALGVVGLRIRYLWI